MMHFSQNRSLPRALGALALMGLLSGCAAISAVSGATKTLDVYELRPPPTIEPVSQRPAPRDVIIEQPTTGGALATDRIMIRPARLQAQYLPDVRWSEETPVMVQTMMLRAIEATGAVRYVGRRPLGPSGDFAVITEVVDFNAAVTGEDAAVAQITLIVRLVREEDAQIVASRTFSGTAPAASTETPALVDAFDRAAAGVFTDFARWIAGTVAGS